MSKPTPPVRPTSQRPKPKAGPATPAGARSCSNPSPIRLSSGDAKLMAAVLMEMMKR